MTNKQICLALALASSALPGLAAGPAAQETDHITVEGLRDPAQGASRSTAAPESPAAERSLVSLADGVANLHINAGGAAGFGDLFVLRGLANTPYFSDPSVAVYLDDLPLAGSATFPTALFGLSQATVLRGPQTGLGRAAQGGALLLSSVRPGAQPRVETRVGGGDHDARSAAFDLGAARGARFDATASGVYSRRDGYLYNDELARSVDDQRTLAGTARLQLHASDTNEFALQLFASRQRNGAQPLAPLDGPRYRVSRGREGVTDIDFLGAAFRADFDIAPGRLSSITSHTDWSLDPYQNRLVLPPTLDSQLTQTQRYWNEELRFAFTAGGWSVNLGGWFSSGESTGAAYREIPDLFPIEASQFELDSRSIALFGEASITPAPRWRLTAGLRAETVRKSFDRSQTVPDEAAFSGERDFDSLLPRLEVSYAPRANLTFSAGLSRGARPGGWSAYTADATLAPFDSETLTAFETGAQLILPDAALTLAVRTFVYDIRDYQIERSFNASDYLVVNAPRARALGGELELEWRPLSELSFSAAFGLTDITLREFTDPFTTVSYADSQAPYAPEYDLRLAAAWRRAGWFVAADATAIGRTFYEESENPAFAQNSRTLLGARLGYETSRWRATAFGENLSGKEYWAYIVPGVGHAAPGAPRRWGVELTWSLAR